MDSSTIAREIEYRSVAVKAEKVVVGDAYVPNALPDASSEHTRWSITEVKVGRRWVYLKSEKAGRPDVTKTFEVEVGTEVVVVRGFETEASVEARTNAAMECWILNEVTSWTPEMPDALAKIAEDVAKGYKVTSFTLDALVTAQAQDIVWGNYVDWMKGATEHGKSATEGRELYCNRLRDKIVQRAGYGNSRSTSVVSNAMDDAETAAMARFLLSY